jgi:hypothetical protein
MITSCRLRIYQHITSLLSDQRLNYEQRWIDQQTGAMYTSSSLPPTNDQHV